jgi:hypothetical protein
MVDIHLNNTGTMEVSVVQQDVIAKIAGGEVQQISRATSFTVDGTLSSDPDETPTPFTYSWACTNASRAASCDGLALDAASTSTIAAGTLPIGDYVFTLTVNKGGRTNSADVHIGILAGAFPAISIGALSQTKYNADDGYALVTASVSSTLSYTMEWIADNSDVEDLFLVKGALISKVSGKLMAVLSLSSLTPGSHYTIRLTATDSDGESSFATVTLAMNEEPGSGIISVEPCNGFALDTSFEFSALNWIDDDLPLTYVFGTAAVERDGTDGTLDTSFLSPFGDALSDASYSGITLSQGFNHSNYTVGAYVRAIDSYGATGIATTKVHVQPKVMSMGELFNLSVALATDALESGNADTAKQVLSATVNSMAYTNTDV